jgi:hypothetical protein
MFFKLTIHPFLIPCKHGGYASARNRAQMTTDVIWAIGYFFFYIVFSFTHYVYTYKPPHTQSLHLAGYVKGGKQAQTTSVVVWA